MTTTKTAKDGEMEINGKIYVLKSSVESNVKAPSLKGLKLVLIRSYAAGVHYGYLQKREDLLSGLKVTLVKSRRIWYWDGANSLSQLAMDGINASKIANCKFSIEVPEIEITQCIEVIPVTAKAADSINAIPVWKQ